MVWSDKRLHKGDGYEIMQAGDGTPYVRYREPRIPGYAMREQWRLSVDESTTNYFLKKAVLEMAELLQKQQVTA